MKIKILLLILTLLGSFVIIIFFSDFFIDRKEVNIFDKYSIVQINGEYNLMHKEKYGYSLVVPNVSNVYTKEKEIIAISNLNGSNFINNNYQSKYSALDGMYFYCISSNNIKEISKNEFLKNQKFYKLMWNNN
ncbi:hypothetical protein [uncultured Chryseobacterium sp.]|uniref:hypothetical protein n=1 Tax=uncultured Chryseobacterium sp. TaxID=259322 RepID=UPI00258DB459|nr:hypothetical protein [uncultured Chryseobacterium sp.]